MKLILTITKYIQRRVAKCLKMRFYAIFGGILNPDRREQMTVGYLGF